MQTMITNLKERGLMLTIQAGDDEAFDGEWCVFLNPTKGVTPGFIVRLPWADTNDDNYYLNLGYAPDLFAARDLVRQFAVEHADEAIR